MCALHDGQIVEVAAAADLLFPLTFETLDNRAALPFPKILKFAEDGRAGRRGGASSRTRSLRPGFGANGEK